MNKKSFNTDSKFLLKKCAGGSRVGVDTISQLPDEIIIHILSFLSLKEVISTSVLSSRWSGLWKYTPNLNFNTKLLKIKPTIFDMSCDLDLEESWDVEKCKYIQIVNSVLNSHEALSLKEFKISLYVNKSAKSTVTKWLKILFSRQVESLELDFLCEDEMYMVSLEDLLRDGDICQPQIALFFKSLKSLCLKYFQVSGEDIDFLLHNCLQLEQLSIHNTLLTSNVVVCGTTLVLKKLDISCCQGENSIKVSAPKLRWLKVDSTSKKLLLENLSKLIVADFTCRSESLDDAKHFAFAFSCCTPRLKFLHLYLHHPKMFLANDISGMRYLKRMAIKYCGVYGHGLLPVTALIWASPRLQDFNLVFINLLGREPTQGLANISRRPHKHLKVFRFEGFCVDAADHIELVTYISDNSVALKTIFISCYSFFESEYDPTGFKRIAKAEADSIRTKQLLQGKLPRHINLHVSVLPFSCPV